MKAGDIVHVPANVTLVRNAPVGHGLEGMRHFVTKVPKKALLTVVEGNYCFIEYGGHSWNVSKKDITLVEYKDDS